MSAPGVAAAVGEWPWWVPIALSAPGYFLYVRAGCRRTTPLPARSRGMLTTLAFAAGPLGVLIANTVDERYWGLALPAAVLVYDLIARLLWWHHDRAVVTARP